MASKERQIDIYGFSFVTTEDGLYKIMQGHEFGDGSTITLSWHDILALHNIINDIIADIGR
jgi:hypothetical protein